jgi:hypothetical protein
LRYEEVAVAFNAEETEAFLGASGRSGRAIEDTRAKFEELGLTEGFPILARNLERMLRLQGGAIPSKA